MARKKKDTEEQEVNNWQDKISSAERFRDTYKRSYLWETFLMEYKCLWDRVLPPEVTPFNFVFSWAKTEVASLYSRDPHVEVNPTKNATVEQAKLRELLISDFIRRKKSKREIKRMLLDGKLIGHGWLKVGYNADFDTMVDRDGNQLQTIINEDYFMYRIPWHHVTFNPDSINVPYDCRWMAHEFWIPIEDLKKKKGWRHVEQMEKNAAPLRRSVGDRERYKDRKDLSNSLTPDSLNYYDDAKMVQVYEIWDIKNKEVKYMSPGVSGYVFNKPWPYRIMKGFPFSYFCPNPINDEPYGIPDPFTWHDQLLELIKDDYTIDDHVKKGNRQIAVSEDNEILPESVKAYEDGQTGAIIRFRQVSSDKLAPMPYMNVNPDVYALRQIRKENILNVSGQSATERGATERTSTRTFRELALIDRGAKNRRSEQEDVMEDTLEDAFGKIMALQAEFGDMPYYVRVTGQQPQNIVNAIMGRPSATQPGSITNVGQSGIEGFTVTREDIGMDGKEEFDVEIQAGSTIPRDRETKIQMLNFVAENAVQSGAIPGGPLMGTIARRYFEEMDDPELIMALEAERQAQQQIIAKREEASKTATQLEAANEAAQLQIKAEREVTKKGEADIKRYNAQTDRIKAVEQGKTEREKAKRGEP